MAKNPIESTNADHQHGSTLSYAVGFILSLGLTIVPYYMVTRQIMGGQTLLLIILGLAVLQMIVQIFFFLHLGRGPKPLYNIVFFGATAGLIVLVVGASLIIMNSLYRNMSPQEMVTRLAQEENIAELNGKPTGACQGNKADHVVIIKDTIVSPSHIDAHRCDTLTIKNEDTVDYEFNFGTHDNHVSYGGLYEVPVRSGRYKAITLNEIGSFGFHVHDDPAINGHFIVNP